MVVSMPELLTDPEDAITAGLQFDNSRLDSGLDPMRPSFVPGVLARMNNSACLMRSRSPKIVPWRKQLS
jgi:hypothetical protein